MRERVELKRKLEDQTGIWERRNLDQRWKFSGTDSGYSFRTSDAAGKISGRMVRDALFIGKNDWVYECRFEACPERKKPSGDGGLRYVCIYLAQRKTSWRACSFYLPGEFETTGLLKRKIS